MQVMEQPGQYLEDIKVIKKIMEESSRFLSLSGLSGVFPGIFALAGAVAAMLVVPETTVFGKDYVVPVAGAAGRHDIIRFLVADAAVVLLLSLATALFFSYRKAKKSGHRFWTPVSKRMLLSLVVPLAAGGLFVILTLGRIPGWAAGSATLVFYGLALVNAGKFTFGEIYWLGIIEIVTGLICIMMPGYTIIFWAFGFGIMHIVYGLYMYIRYKG